MIDWLNRGRLRPTLVGAALALAFLAACCSFAAGCGAASTQHRTLNGLTDIADPTYDVAVDLCDTLRDRIVARTDSTREEDRADMDAVHEACDPMVLGFEALRGTQVTARAAINGGVEDAAARAIAEALGMWPQVQALARRIIGGE